MKPLAFPTPSDLQIKIPGVKKEDTIYSECSYGAVGLDRTS